jgi:hypothetical protein
MSDDIVGTTVDIFEKVPAQQENVQQQVQATQSIEQVQQAEAIEQVQPVQIPQLEEVKIDPVDSMLTKLPKDTDLTKMTGIVIAELGLKASAAEELVGEAFRVVENDFLDKRRLDHNNFQKEVLTQVYAVVEEARYQEEKAQKAEYERDLRITVAAQKMFGEEMAREIVDAAEDNFSRNTKIPKHLVKKSLSEADYTEMLRSYRGSEDHFKVLNKDLSMERTQDMAQKTLSAMGIKYEQPKQQRSPNYAEIRRENIDAMLQKYTSGTKH